MPRRKKSDPKIEVLREHGTLNPDPDQVVDPAFLEDEFFDPRDLLQVKYEMLRRVRCDGHSVVQATRQFGLSRPTFYKARSDFEQFGLAGLLPAKRGPQGPHKLTEPVMAFVAEQLSEDETLSNSSTSCSNAEKRAAETEPVASYSSKSSSALATI